jgi:hypothetical protein
MTGFSTSTVTVRNNNSGVIVGAVVSRNGTTNQWILNPNASLAVNVQFPVTLTGGATAIRDTTGNPLATTTWSFTTGG